MKEKIKKYGLLIIIFSGLFISDNFIYAHPGNTDSSGCHTCYTNCSSWGLYYGEYHCHNNKGTSQPLYPISSTYGSGGTGYTTPNPSYAYPSIPTTPSCPSMSSYNSLSGSCECYSGYVVDTDFLGKENCVSANTKCTESLGYGGEYDILSKSCDCRYGYVYSGSKCISESTYCSNQLGLMSRYNSLLGKCECMSGYEFDGSSCVYKKTSYSYPSAYSSNASGCPTNSHTSITDLTKCQCDVGFQANSTKDGCIVVPTKTNNQICQDSFGINSDWDGTKTNDGQLNCFCQTGFQFNSNKTDCVKTTCYSNASLSLFNNQCYCDVGYQWNSDKTGCVKQVMIPAITTPLTNDNPIGAVNAPTCTISISPSVIKQGESANQKFKIIGPVSKVVWKADGILSYMGSGLVEDYPEISSGREGGYKIKPESIGIGSETIEVYGPNGTNGCSATIKVVSKDENTAVSVVSEEQQKNTNDNQKINQPSNFLTQISSFIKNFWKRIFK